MLTPDIPSLITLSRIDRLPLAIGLYGAIVLAPAVRNALDESPPRPRRPSTCAVPGKLRSIRNARLTPDENQFVKRLLKSATVHRSEAECLALARRPGTTLVLADREARTIARSLGLCYTGVPGLLAAGLRYRRLTRADFRRALDDLTGVVWPSSDTVSAMLSVAR